MIPSQPVRRGRPRSSAADRRIVSATLDLFAEVGYEGLSVERVAEIACVSKATIYRRHPDKSHLVVTALSGLRDVADPQSDTGTLVGDLRSIADHLVDLLQDTPVGGVVAHVVAESSHHPDLAAALHEFVALRRAPAIAAIRRAVERGELRVAVDPEALVDQVVGPLFYRHLLSGASLGRTYVERVVGDAVAAYGLRPED